MGPALSLIIGIFVVLVITAFTAWFVAQEFAFMAVDRSRAAARAQAGDANAARTLEVTRSTSFMLSGAQLGITVTGLVVGYVAEPLIGGALRDMGTAVGVSKSASAIVGAVTALLLSTVIQMVLGELFPKNYAIARPDDVSNRLAASTLGYLRLFKPFIALFDRASEALLRLLRIEPVHDVEHAATVRDLKHIVGESRGAGELPAELSDMVDRALEFPVRIVAHAMIPRARVDVVQATTPIAAMRTLMEGGHTRYPVMENDEVVGVVELLDVLPQARDDEREIREIMRPPFLISTFTVLPDALTAMREDGSGLAIVVDEFGGFTGVLSLEDLAEEIVGEIDDEHDPDEVSIIIHEGDDGGWSCPAATPTDEVERALDILLPPGAFETIGGAAMAYHGGFVDVGTRVEVPLPVDPGEFVTDAAPQQRYLLVDVTDVANQVPSTVRLHLEARNDPQGGDDA